MKRCSFCDSYGFIKATVKETGTSVLVCAECDTVYELDDNDQPIMETDLSKTHYIGEADYQIKSWDDLVTKGNCVVK